LILRPGENPEDAPAGADRELDPAQIPPDDLSSPLLVTDARQADAPDLSAASRDVACTGCLRLFKEEEVTRVGESALCRSCREGYLAKGQVLGPEFPRADPGPSVKRPELKYAGFWIRAAAFLADTVLLELVFEFFLTPVLLKFLLKWITGSVALLQSPSAVDPGQIQGAMAGLSSPLLAWILISGLARMTLFGAYFTILEGGPGQTLGKKVLGLRVVTAKGGRIGYLRALARSFGKLISGMILGLGFILAAFDREKRTVHDRMCGTRVVKV